MNFRVRPLMSCSRLLSLLSRCRGALKCLLFGIGQRRSIQSYGRLLWPQCLPWHFLFGWLIYCHAFVVVRLRCPALSAIRPLLCCSSAPAQVAKSVSLPEAHLHGNKQHPPLPTSNPMIMQSHARSMTFLPRLQTPPAWRRARK